ncbi:MAG: AMP-binding protein [Deltaproteobacteria bacterium]|nr:MAG: AMP-binding protein [Deltaproteobacteria bacterium]
MNIAKNLERSAFYFPDRPVVSEESSETSYAHFNERANRVATALIKMGIKPGDHIGLCAPNSGDWLSFYFGVLKAGAVAVALSSLLKRDELSLLINHSKPRIIFTFDEKLDELAELRRDEYLERIISPEGDMNFHQLLEMGTGSFNALDRDRTDTAAILYTGGTTGTPKGVMLSHENINAAIHTVVFNERSNETDRPLCFLPFNHVFGQMHIMNATILSAGCLEVMPTFDMDRVLYATGAGRVTKLFAVPTIYVRLLAIEGLKEKLGSVRYCLSAAATMAADAVRQWKDRTGLAIYEGYGMTEAAPTVTYNHRYRHVIGSVGTEVPGVEVQIRDQNGDQVKQGHEGEICVRGPNIMKGYLDDPEGTREAFWEGEWFRSGDVGLFDDDGYLYIVDRLKDMIITGGENVYSREVEEVLYTRPEIQECAVIGLPDREWGERVTAFILLRSGEPFDKDTLHAYMKSRLAPFKVPKEYVTVDDFPRSPAGKILKRELRKQFLA